MEIAVIVPNRLMTEAHLEERRNFLMSHVQAGTKVQMIKLEHGPISIESSMEHEQAGSHIAKKVQEMDAQGLDAFITWCGEDAGVVSASEVTKIPVIGPLQSSCALAILLGHRFTVLGPMVQRAFMERMVWAYGLGSRLASIRTLGIPVLEVQCNRDRVQILLREEAFKALREDGADVIVLSCMALYGMAQALAAEISAPVIDPALAALKMAETQASLGLSHSKRTYPFPPKGSG
jgi:allantoin racemase